MALTQELLEFTLCVREPNFEELIEVLGDRDAQDKIREANPMVDHCKMLKRNPNACLDFERTGAVCPNHPFLGQRAKDVQRLQEKYGDIQTKKALANLFLRYIGVEPNLSMCVYQFVLISTVAAYYKNVMAENQSVLIYNRMADLVNGMFKK